MTSDNPDAYILSNVPAIDAILRGLVGCRAVFFAGLPGTGKSLFVHQLAYLAHSARRPVHLLQWDVARPVFEASPQGQRYPVIDGVTPVVIRRAVGFWARGRVLEWSQAYPGGTDILIGEVPLIGNRLIELVTPADDAAEPFLASDECAFALPVPSNDVRQHIEAQRRHRFEAPQHTRELEDAPPDVMRDTWLELLQSAHDRSPLPSPPQADAPFDSTVYRRLYEHLLQHRHTRVIEINAVLPTDSMSVYNYPPGIDFILPPPDEIEGWIAKAEQGFSV